MAETINIANRETNFQGLWYHKDEHRYTSAVILGSSLKNLKGKFRIVMYKNKYHNEGDNRPSYNIKFCGVDADDICENKIEFGAAICDIDDDETLIQIIKEYTGKRLYTKDEVYKVIHGMEEEYELSYDNDLISDYVYIPGID